MVGRKRDHDSIGRDEYAERNAGKTRERKAFKQLLKAEQYETQHLPTMHSSVLAGLGLRLSALTKGENATASGPWIGLFLWDILCGKFIKLASGLRTVLRSFISCMVGDRRSPPLRYCCQPVSILTSTPAAFSACCELRVSDPSNGLFLASP